MSISSRLLTALVLILGAGCGGGSDSGERAVVVFAAASLTDAFDEVVDAFEAANPDVDVELNAAGSSSLREQILAGAPADVFASANEATMQTVVASGETTEAPVVFATNRMVIAVPPGNPAGVTSLDAFGDDDLLIGLCAAGVPCGDLARSILDAAEIVPDLDTEELDVRALLFKISEGDLDAGLVYASDLVATDAVGIESPDVPSGADFQNRYLIATLRGGTNPDDAADFAAFVSSPAAQAILVRHGFGTP